LLRRPLPFTCGLIFVVLALEACQSATASGDRVSTGEPGPTSIDAKNLGTSCAGGSNPGTARALVSSSARTRCACSTRERTRGAARSLVAAPSATGPRVPPDSPATAQSGSDGGAEAGVDAGPPPIKRAFVTSQPTLGNFGGAKAADGLCQAAATTAHLCGTFRALIESAETTAPLTQAGPFYLVDSGSAAASGSV